MDIESIKRSVNAKRTQFPLDEFANVVAGMLLALDSPAWHRIPASAPNTLISWGTS
jgi:hypothetical protein